MARLFRLHKHVVVLQIDTHYCGNASSFHCCILTLRRRSGWSEAGTAKHNILSYATNGQTNISLSELMDPEARMQAKLPLIRFNVEYYQK